jgi:hypothetical protein
VAELFIEGYLDTLHTLRPGEVRPWHCIGYGHGGIAYTLLKAGTLRGDRALLGSARRWAAAGLRSGRRLRWRGWCKQSFGRGLTGLHAIHLLTAHAEGDDTACGRELQRFVESTRRGRGTLELFQGTAGRLAGAAIVMRHVPHPVVRTLGDDLGARVVAALDARRVQLHRFGMAHGRQGLVLGALVWHAVARSLPEDALRRAVLAEHPYDVSALVERRQADWAHGHAGMAMLFARAYLLLGDRRFLAWAREAAAQARALANPGILLLDGSPGLAYSLLAVAEADPDGPWRDEAWAIAGEVFARVQIPTDNPFGVWGGLGGLCCLALDLIHETEARFPGIEA